VRTLRATNLALKFFLELGAIAAFAYWGASVDGGAVAVLMAVVTSALAVVLWAVLAAPKSKRRLPDAARVAFELAVFGLAIVALLAAGRPAAAIVFAVAVTVNVTLLTVFHQWDR
jgi:hypothetical protein